MSIFNRKIPLHIVVQFEFAEDAENNLVVEWGIFYRIWNTSASLSAYFLILHLIVLSLARLMLMGYFTNMFFLLLQGPSDNNANLQTYIFRSLIC